MKKLSKLLSVFVLIFPLLVGCGDEDDDPILSITTSGDVGGSVSGGEDLNLLIDSVACYVYQNEISWGDYEYMLGADKFENGKFEIELETPPSSCLYPFLDIFGDVWDETTFTDINLSDSTVKVTDYLYFDAYKDSEYVGYIVRTNMTIEQFYSDMPQKGWASADYFYCDGDVKYTAIEEGSYDYDDDVILRYEYDLDMKKGWNEVIFQCSSVSGNMIKVKVFANAEPSGMKWMFDEDMWDDYSKVVKSTSLKSNSSLWKALSRKK